MCIRDSIASTHGLKGEVKVFPTTDDPERFRKLKKIYLDTGKEYKEDVYKRQILPFSSAMTWEILTISPGLSGSMVDTVKIQMWIRDRHRCLGIAPGRLPVSPSDTLSHLYLTAHAGHGRQPLGQPDIHAAHADTGHRLGAQPSDPGHIRNIIQSPKER